LTRLAAIPEETPKSKKRRLIMFLMRSFEGRVLEGVQCLFSLLSCIFFVLETYTAKGPETLIFVEDDFDFHFGNENCTTANCTDVGVPNSNVGSPMVPIPLYNCTLFSNCTEDELLTSVVEEQDLLQICIFAGEILFSTFFTYQYVLGLYIAVSKVRYVLGLQPVIDTVTIPPVFLVLFMGYTSLSALDSDSEPVAVPGEVDKSDNMSFWRFARIMKFARVLRLLRLFRGINKVKDATNDAVFNQFINFATVMLSMIVLTTGNRTWNVFFCFLPSFFVLHEKKKN
jgi:hypothetical protein